MITYKFTGIPVFENIGNMTFISQIRRNFEREIFEFSNFRTQNLQNCPRRGLTSRVTHKLRRTNKQPSEN